MLPSVQCKFQSAHFFAFLSYRRFIQRRSIITDSIEPPLVSKIPEKPCTFVLVEDHGLYEESWMPRLRDCFPSDHGIHFCHQSLHHPTLKEALNEMKHDFASFPATVLMARGPTVSLLAQYYLESLPLSGLIMVDPIVEPLSSEFLDSLQSMYSLKSIREREFLQGLQKDLEKKGLKLEAGVIPMFVISTIPSLEDQALATVLRHRNPKNRNGEVSFLKLIESEKLIHRFIRWIEETVV
jgi:hypothetical protein